MAGIAAQKLDKLLSRFQALLNAADEGAEETVHRLRTTARRIEAIVLNLGFTPESHYDRVLKSISRVRRRAGKVRDLDIQIRMLQSVAIDSAYRQREDVMQSLQSARVKHARRLTKKVDEVLDGGIVEDLHELSRLAAALPSQRRSLFVDRALDLFAEIAANFTELHEKNLHDFRIACRKVRYLVEIADTLRDGKRVAELVKELQDAIGAWHDWTELTKTACDVLGRNTPLVTALRAQRRSALHHALLTARLKREELLGMRAARLAKHRKLPTRKGPQRVRTAAADHTSSSRSA